MGDKKKYETCCRCEQTTGRSRYDDSIRVGDLGPLCEVCFDELGQPEELTCIRCGENAVCFLDDDPVCEEHNRRIPPMASSPSI